MNYEVREQGTDAKPVAPRFDDPLDALHFAKALAGRQATRFWVWRVADEKLIAECGTSLTLTNRSRALNLVNGVRDPSRNLDRAKEFRAKREHCAVTGGLHDWEGTGAEFRCRACSVLGRMQLERVVVKKCQARYREGDRRNEGRWIRCSALATHHYTSKRGMVGQYVTCEEHRHGWGASEEGAA